MAECCFTNYTNLMPPGWIAIHKKTAVMTTVCAAAVITGCLLAPAASAETVDLGGTADVDLIDIELEQHWTVGNLKPSTDAIDYRPAGTLWEATVTTELDNGGVPVVSGFFARADDADYPVLWNVASTTGIPPNPLPPGGSATGKIYFDVTGSAPSGVAYTAGNGDVIVWE